ncbi:2-alkenal reductase (NADP(+)-dependent)-like [Senna tora]|uniref:2-alkenal reductase (NADP(+)-dependent)-like n=1 Tax=Senna tora TaxID=362788 RepID=A0A834T0M0_9FABA|nr:2-alkenal reductase (NADP(+)-dependent)-like [Senna tora]
MLGRGKMRGKALSRLIQSNSNIVIVLEIVKNSTRYFPEGIDIYFENVGGDMLEAALLNMRRRGRIVVAGMISQYDLEEPQPIKNLLTIIYKQVRIEAFTVFDYYHLYSKFLDTMMPYIREGKVSYIEAIAEGLENGPTALEGIFTGRNPGKQVILVAQE